MINFIQQFLEKAVKAVIKHDHLYLVLSFTWGILATIIGYLVLLVLLPFGHVTRLNGVTYFSFKKQQVGSFSIGNIIFLSMGAHCDTVYHETGHILQNAIFGPFMFLLVYIPSVIRFWFRLLYFKKHPNSRKSKYLDVWFEKTASEYGTLKHNYDCGISWKA